MMCVCVCVHVLWSVCVCVHWIFSTHALECVCACSLEGVCMPVYVRRSKHFLRCYSSPLTSFEMGLIVDESTVCFLEVFTRLAGL